MTKQLTPEDLTHTFDEFIMETCDVMHTLAILRTYGFDLDQRESIIATWKGARAINRGAQAGNDLITELYGKIEAMGKANPIIQTLRSIQDKMMHISNQAHAVASDLIPFATTYPDLPTLRFLGNLCSAIDDLPLAFVNHFSTELDMLRVHSRATGMWLSVLKVDDEDADFDSGAALRRELHKDDEQQPTPGLDAADALEAEMHKVPEPRETLEGDFRWVCEKCGKVNNDVDLCECGEMSTWRKLAIEADKRNKYPY